MGNKIVVGLALGLGMLAVLIIGGWLLFAVIVLGGGAGLWEYYNILKKKDMKPLTALGIAFGMAFIAMAFLGKFVPVLSNGMTNIGSVVSVYVIVVLIIQFWQIVKNKTRYRISDLSLTVFGSLYIGAFGSFLFLLMIMGEQRFPGDLFRSRLVLFLPMWSAWGSDVGAYFAGRFLGRNRIFPELSPKKTLEGCLGGIALCVVGYGVFSFPLGIPFSHALTLGVIASAFGQIGDLSESALKREFGVKDSGTVFGSHGGFLDRIDSLLFTAPAVYHYFAWVNPWGM